MNKILAIFTAALFTSVVMLWAGCTTVAPTAGGNAAVALLSPAAAARIICMPVQTAISQGRAILLTTPPSDQTALKIQAAMKVASPIIDVMCKAGATVTATTIQDFATQAIPALASIVPVLPITDVQKQQAQAILLSAAVTVGMVEGIAANVKAQAAQAASAPSAAPTPGPVSGPLSLPAGRAFVLSAK